MAHTFPFNKNAEYSAKHLAEQQWGITEGDRGWEEVPSGKYIKEIPSISTAAITLAEVIAAI